MDRNWGERRCLIFDNAPLLRGLMLRHPPDDLLPIGGVDAEKIIGFTGSIDEDVVFDSSPVVADHGVLGLTGSEFRHVVGRHPLKKGQAPRPGDRNSTHVADVKKPGL
jgi:hypothetical protein